MTQNFVDYWLVIDYLLGAIHDLTQPMTYWLVTSGVQKNEKKKNLTLNGLLHCWGTMEFFSGNGEEGYFAKDHFYSGSKWVSYCYTVIVVVNSNKIKPNNLNAEKIKFTIIM